ncbi:MAG TPA: methyltransferase domain-containing protein [Vicinamibacterales bacterium]|nr:methyltransferase domain-containing protein [Vicinamibacterales bacterium]
MIAREWNAASYHRVSGPQTEWGRKVLNRLTVRGDERVVDAGCGSGRLTGELLRRLPDGHVTAVDRSWNMLTTARDHLKPEFGARVAFCQVALPLLPIRDSLDLVFSTATFHWVHDHPALFREIYDALRGGGRLFAQCGGGPNLAVAHALAETVMRSDTFAPYFRDWRSVWEFASAEVTAERLGDAGFVDVITSLEPATTTFDDVDSYREFVTTVIFNPHLERIPDGALRARFIDEVTRRAADATPALTLDYWRLNLEGSKS